MPFNKRLRSPNELRKIIIFLNTLFSDVTFVPSGFLLQEDGFYILQEDGSRIII